MNFFLFDTVWIGWIGIGGAQGEEKKLYQAVNLYLTKRNISLRVSIFEENV
jgi:hypothetical protein